MRMLLGNGTKIRSQKNSVLRNPEFRERVHSVKKCERCKKAEVLNYFPMADLCDQCRWDWWDKKFDIKLGKIIEKTNDAKS